MEEPSASPFPATDDLMLPPLPEHSFSSSRPSLERQPYSDWRPPAEWEVSRAPSRAASRTPSRAPSRPESRASTYVSQRKFSFVKSKAPKPNSPGFHFDTIEEYPPEYQELFRKIPNHVERETGRSFQELALEDIKGVPDNIKLGVLEEYVRVPRKNSRIVDMLRVPAEKRTTIRDRVKAARDGLDKRALDEWKSEAMGNEWEQDLKKHAEHRLTIGLGLSMPTADGDSLDPDNNEEAANKDIPDVKDKHLAPLQSFGSYWRRSSDFNALRGMTASNRTSFTEGSRQSFYKQDSVSATSLVTPEYAAHYARVAQEAGVSRIHAPMTSAVIDYLTLLSSRQASQSVPNLPRRSGYPRNYRHKLSESFIEDIEKLGIIPGPDNPFASFLHQLGATEVAELPLELKRSYFAHNEVQDALRNSLRMHQEQTNLGLNGEQIARQFWDMLPRDFPVSIEVEGETGTMKPLSTDELIYMWTMRFLERCEKEGW